MTLARRLWPLIAAAAVVVALLALARGLGTAGSADCITLRSTGRELCGDQARAWCKITAPFAALAEGLNGSERDLRWLRRYAPAQAAQVERQAAETRRKLAEHDRLCRDLGA